MTGGVHMRPCSQPHPRRCVVDDGRQQHDRRVEAQHRRGRDREAEDRQQQPPAAAACRSRQPVAGGFEQTLLGAEVREHQHCCKEDEDRQQPIELCVEVVGRDDVEDQQQAGGGNRDDRLGEAVWSHDRSDQHGGEQHERCDFLHVATNLAACGEVRLSGSVSSSHRSADTSGPGRPSPSNGAAGRARPRASTLR